MNTEQKIFTELIETVLKNSENNIATITNVKLWAENWRKEMKEALILNGVVAKLKDKKITDLLNWVKSDLKTETNAKIGKTATPYRTEKIKFLNKLLEIERF